MSAQTRFLTALVSNAVKLTCTHFVPLSTYLRADIVQYLDSSSDGQHLNIFLEYVPGGSVAALLSNYGAFEEALVSKFVRQILTGLEYLHEREIVHRDIKGANILVDNKGGIKISDFGISKRVEDSQCRADSCVCTWMTHELT